MRNAAVEGRLDSMSRRRAGAAARVLVAALVAAGCGASSAARIPSVRVDEEVRDELPLEGRRWAYEAENEVIIALDRRDDAREALARARARLGETEDAADRSKAKEPSRAKVAWREEQRRLADARLDEAEIGVYCARTSFELTKARLAVRFGFPVKEGYVPPFEAQYEACAKELAAASEGANAAEARAAKALEKWRDSRREYVTRTGDHDHGLWTD
ncbi:hypothetical protein [Vulgatibacter incomptus]|nr:hypothetical protein [Vulgatibacter incomptus]